MNKGVLLLTTILTAASIAAQDYSALHEKLIKFYGYQRAGLKTGNSGNLNNKSSHGGDNYNNHELDGGWYDAGDYIKFGMPLGYTVYCLLKGYDIFPGSYTDVYKADNSSGADGIPDILNQIKYATDYLMKAVIDENTIVLDVGVAEDEHSNFPFDQIPYPTGRSGSQIRTCTGADIPATYAACLALMSILFRKFDAAYADRCLAKAITAFKFAKKKIDAGGDNNLYCQAQKKANAYLYYYHESNDGKTDRQIGDRMAAAGVELYRATDNGDPVYLTWAKKGISESFNCMGYSFIGPLAAFEVWRQKITAGAPSISANAGFIEGKVQTGGVFEGVYRNSNWGTARDIGTAAFVYALAYIINPAENARTLYLKRVKDHIGWVAGYFGTTKRSYVIGFNNSPATVIHYRPNRSGPQGGVVTGPDDNGIWENNGTADYCEVALEYNAGIVGAVAFIKALSNPGAADVEIKQPLSATPGSNVDFTGGGVLFTATFSKPVAWTLKITGGFGSKTISKTGTSINEAWDGSADKGFFLGGESVTVQLAIEGTIAVWDLAKANGLSLSIARAKKIPPQPDDALIDDFEDGDTLNNVSGFWSPIGSQTSFSGKTRITFTPQDSSVALSATCNVASDDRSTFAGVKTTFNPGGTPMAVPLTNNNMITFDLKAGRVATVYVELDQPARNVNDYPGIAVPVTTVKNSYRVKIADFKTPDGTSGTTPEALKSTIGLRFTIYDSTGRIDLFLDNVSLQVSNGIIAGKNGRQAFCFHPVLKNRTLVFGHPGISTPMECTVFDLSGRCVLRRSLNGNHGDRVAIPLDKVHEGIYTVTLTGAGTPIGKGSSMAMAITR